MKGDDAAALAADAHDYPVADHQWRAADGVAGQVGLELLVEIHLPEAFAVLDLITGQEAVDAHRVETFAGDGGSGARPPTQNALVRRARIAVFPQGLAGGCIEGEDFFLRLVLVLGAGVDEDPPTGNDRRAEALADRFAPEHLGSFLLGPGGDLFGGAPVPFWAEPLRPIGGTDSRRTD